MLKLLISTTVLCFPRRIDLLFGAVLSHPSQSCFSRILCNLLHLPLWCVYPVGVIRLNIATTSARRLKFVL